jgi:uncharacterized protein (DUF2336 family)
VNNEKVVSLGMEINGNKTARQLVANLPDALDSHLVQHMTEEITGDLTRKLNASLVAAIQKHIPEARIDNIAQYADRITVIQQAGRRYPERYYLDHGTPNEMLICEVGEPATEFFGTELPNLYQPITIY